MRDSKNLVLGIVLGLLLLLCLGATHDLFDVKLTGVKSYHSTLTVNNEDVVYLAITNMEDGKTVLIRIDEKWERTSKNLRYGERRTYAP